MLETFPIRKTFLIFFLSLWKLQINIVLSCYWITYILILLALCLISISSVKMVAESCVVYLFFSFRFFLTHFLDLQRRFLRCAAWRIPRLNPVVLWIGVVLSGVRAKKMAARSRLIRFSAWSHVIEEGLCCHWFYFYVEAAALATMREGKLQVHRRGHPSNVSASSLLSVGLQVASHVLTSCLYRQQEKCHRRVYSFVVTVVSFDSGNNSNKCNSCKYSPDIPSSAWIQATNTRAMAWSTCGSRSRSISCNAFYVVVLVERRILRSLLLSVLIA
jgi:hypothetical protein